MELVLLSVAVVGVVVGSKLLRSNQVVTPPPPVNTTPVVNNQNQQAQGLGGTIGNALASFFGGASQPQTSTGTNQLYQGIGAGLGSLFNSFAGGGGGVNANYQQTATTPQVPSTDVNGWNSFPGAGPSQEGYKLSDADISDFDPNSDDSDYA